MPSDYEKSRDFRSKIVQMVEDDQSVTWEMVAMCFIVQGSQDDNESVYDELQELIAS